MKTFMSNPRFYLFLFFLIAIQQIQSQVIEPTTNKSSQELYDFYTLKQKKNNTTALVLLGAGVIITIGNYISYSNNTTGGFGGNVPDTSQIVVFGIGGASSLASIPFFIAAGTNKRRAMLSLKKVQNSVGNITFDHSNYLSVSVTIPF